MKRFVKRVLLAVGILLMSSAAQPAIDLVDDDTDLFMVNPAVSSERPNVLLMLDNSANWNSNSGGVTKRSNEMSAIYSVVSGLTDQFNLGLMLWMESTGNPSTAENSAAYVRFGIRQMTGDITDTETNKGRLGALANYIKTAGESGGTAANNDQSSSSFVYALGHYESYRYFRGQSSSPNYGAVATARDFTGNPSTRSAPYIGGLTDNPLTSAASTTYRSPITSKCQKNFVIIISNGVDGSASNQGKGYDRLAEVFAETAVGTPTEITPTAALTFPTTTPGVNASAVPANGVWLDEWTRYMANNDCGPGTSDTKRPVFTYVVDVDPATDSASRSFSALLFNAAKEGKGEYVPVANNAQALIDALNRIFQEIQAKNSVFASTTLPVSNNVRGTSLNQVYLGVFRPDGNRLPRWYGNLKLYKLGPNLDRLVGADGSDIFDPTSGFTTSSALSFWTTDSNFWAFRDPNYEPGDASRANDNKDGKLVEKGGAAQRLRAAYPDATSIATRKVYTCVGAACVSGANLSAMQFDDANADVTAASLKAFGTIALASVTNNGTDATATTVSDLGWPLGTVTGVTIEGVSPNNYNGTDLTVTVTGPRTFTYTLAVAPSTTIGLVSATAHSLNIGDTVTVTGATPAGYNVTNAIVLAANYSPNQFAYTMSAPATGSASGATVVATRQFGSVLGASITGTAGTSTATVYWPGHGFSSSPSGGVTIAGSAVAAFNVTGAAISNITPSGFTYTTPTVISSAGSTTTVTVTATNHGLGANGETVNNVNINCGSGCDYGGIHNVTILNANAFQYTVSGSFATIVNTGTFSVTIPITGTVSLSNGTGSNRAIAIGTVPAGHRLGSTGTASINISNLSNTTGNNVKFAANNPYAATLVSSTVFGYVMTCTTTGGASATCPDASTTLSATYTSSRTQIGTISQIAPAAEVRTDTTNTMTMSAQVAATGISVIQAGDTTGATVGSPGTVDPALRTAIINWVRGQDNKDDENANLDLTDVRTSIHGDVLHSRPAVVNYGRDGSGDDVYVYYGTNDGMFRATKGGFASGAGNEVWSFVAPEFFGGLKRLRDNSPKVSGLKPRDYSFDGPVTIYTKDVNRDGRLDAAAGDKVYLYAAMRRGGRMIYAFDVSDPDAPKFMWKKGCPNQNDDTGCSDLDDWDKIGQTWSEPKVGYIRASTNPVLMFGAGYEPAVEDYQPCAVTNNTADAVTGYRKGALTYFLNGACWSAGVASTVTNRNKGRGVFIVDAITGDVVWRVGPDADADRQITGMSYAMPSDLSILNLNGDVQTRTGIENLNAGLIDRIYAVDTGANIWRIDLDHADKTMWAVNKLASLSGSALADKRKFLFSPRVTADPACGSFDAIVLGSGDREHPFSAGYHANPQNPPGGQTFNRFNDRFFMVKDTETSLINPNGTAVADKVPDLTRPLPGAIATDDNLTDLTNDCLGECSAAAKTALAGSKGWRFTLREGEKVVTGVTVQGGLVQFATNQPKGSAGNLSCDSDLGIARAYKVKFCDALTVNDPTTEGGVVTYSRSVDIGEGLPPSPTPAIVCEGATCKEVSCFGANCGEPLSLKLDTRVRTFWYKKGGN